MKISDVIKDAAVYLGKNDVISLIENGATENPSEAERDKQTLIRCVNLVVEQLASEYVPFRTREEVCSLNGEIYFHDLKERVLEVCSVSDRNGVKVNFKSYPQYVKTVKGNLVIEYVYMPENLTENSEVFFSNGKLTERIIAYGVAGEYALTECRYDESAMWDERFKQSLMTVLHPKNVRVRQRRWL